jgi:hypothetical protein
MERWSGAPDPWVAGFWFYGFAYDHLPVISMDADSRQMTLAASPKSGIGADRPFVVLNLLEELDSPGEWYIDRAAGILYFWPPQDLASGEMLVSMLNTPLVEMHDAAYVTFRDMTFEAGRRFGISITGGTSDRIENCTVRNFGTAGVKLVDGTGHTIESCEIYGCGEEGINISAGDRASLTPCRHVVRNCDIHDFGRWIKTNRPGVRLNGVGAAVSHNEIHHGPCMAIWYSGNDQIMEYNDIHDVCGEVDDMGALYSCKDWAGWGCVVRGNFIHQISSILKGKHGVHGVYLDECDSGNQVIGNVFHTISGKAVMLRRA